MGSGDKCLRSFSLFRGQAGDTVTTLYILIGSLVAVSAIVGFNVWIGGWSASRIDDLGEAGRILKQDLLTFSPGDDGVLASDGLSALVADVHGHGIGYLAARGDTHVSRLINPAEVANASVEGDGVIVVRFRDFTFPAARITLGKEDAAREWAARLTAE